MGSRSLALLSATLGGSLALLGGVAQATDPSDQLEVGRTIYQSAHRPDGSPVLATVQQDVPLPPGSGACTTCHRRSGIGVAEGGSRSLNLTAPYLFTATTKPPIRPSYDEASIARAVVAGIAADGRHLSDLMPRYQLSDNDVRALTAYLRTLGAAPSPGVTDNDLEIATIVAADAPGGDREAVEAVVRRFVEIKNASTRREAERAAASDRHYWGHSRDRAYRHWNLSVWTLEGPPATWSAQLQKYYAENPPFAVISGTTGHDWDVVHAFCEAQRLPCILPIVDDPPEQGKDFYTLYYTAGVRLDAEVTARKIAASSPGETPQTVLLVYNDDERGRAASGALREAWSTLGDVTLSEQRISSTRAPSSREWSQLFSAVRPTVLIAWLSGQQLEGLVAARTGVNAMPSVIYTAETFTEWENTVATADFRSRVRHVYPYALPDAAGNQIQRERMWLQARLSASDFAALPLVASAKALFACHVVGEALADMESIFSRDYLLETLEHSLDGTQMTNVYPATTLGPDQRTISRGAYITRLAGEGGGPLFGGAEWVEP